MTDNPETKPRPIVTSAWLSSGALLGTSLEVKVGGNGVIDEREADPADIPPRFLEALADWAHRGLNMPPAVTLPAIEQALDEMRDQFIATATFAQALHVLDEVAQRLGIRPL